MPVKSWSDEQRARHAETIAAKRAGLPLPHRTYRDRPRQRAPQPRTRDRIAQLEVRIETLESLLAGIDAPIAGLLEAIRRSISERSGKPATVVEWRPDHRRLKDGGAPVRAQRRAVGVPRRPRKVKKAG